MLFRNWTMNIRSCFLCQNMQLFMTSSSIWPNRTEACLRWRPGDLSDFWPSPATSARSALGTCKVKAKDQSARRATPVSETCWRKHKPTKWGNNSVVQLLNYYLFITSSCCSYANKRPCLEFNLDGLETWLMALNSCSSPALKSNHICWRRTEGSEWLFWHELNHRLSQLGQQQFQVMLTRFCTLPENKHSCKHPCHKWNISRPGAEAHVFHFSFVELVQTDQTSDKGQVSMC